jgi:hypothetical protein
VSDFASAHRILCWTKHFLYVGFQVRQIIGRLVPGPLFSLHTCILLSLAAGDALGMRSRLEIAPGSEHDKGRIFYAVDDTLYTVAIMGQYSGGHAPGSGREVEARNS